MGVACINDIISWLSKQITSDTLKTPETSSRIPSSMDDENTSKDCTIAREHKCDNSDVIVNISNLDIIVDSKFDDREQI